MLLGSLLLKTAGKMLVKLTLGDNIIIILKVAFEHLDLQ
jgi:hypothetical protein